MINDFRDLKVWKESVVLAKALFKLTDKFPEKHRFGISSQMERSIISVSSNIAEGQGRDSLKEYVRHLSIARGSLFEFRSQVYLSKELGLIDDSMYKRFDKKIGEVSKMLKAMQNSLKKKL